MSARPLRALAALPALAALAGLASLAACADSSTEPTADVATDAVVAADLASAEGLDVASDVALFSAPEAPSGSTTTGTTTVARTTTFYDAAGATMNAYDASLTASVKHVVQVTGSRAGSGPQGSFTESLHRSRTRVVSGLAGQETQQTWNGTGAASDTATHTGALNTRVYTKTVADTATNVVLALPRAANPYPKSGTMVHNVRATVTVAGARTAARSVDRRVVVTFNGTAAVPITVGSASCTLHLDTRSVDGCSR